jgi:hypothetical protein
VGSDQGLPLSAPAFIQQLEDTIPAESALHWNYFKKGFAYEYYTEKQKIYVVCTLPGSARSPVDYGNGNAMGSTEDRGMENGTDF